MKLARTLIIVLGLGVLFGSAAMATKMPMDVYIRTAKIDILSGEPERYQEALDYLDSLNLYYGAIPEAYYWKSMIYVDFIGKTSELQKRTEYVAKFALFVDSLKLACGNEQIKEKYRKNCTKGDMWVPKSDSTRVKFWREFYNEGVKQLQDIRRDQEDMKAVADSSSQAFYKQKLAAAQDTVITMMQLALALDSADHKPYLGIATVYEQKGDYEKSAALLAKALTYTTDETSKSQILLQIAYDYLNLNKYCEAIPFLRQYTDIAVTDVANMYNLAAVYNRCDKYDSALIVYRRMLDVDSLNVDALVGVGKYYNQIALLYSDSSASYRKAGDSSAVKKWQSDRNKAFDSAKVFFETAFRVAPDNQFVAEELGVVCYITEDYQCAIPAFEKLTQLQPNNPDNWTSLGDSYLKTQQWDKAARAYEKVVQIEPDNMPIWESLEALYKELGETENLKKAEEKLKKG